MKQNLKQVFSLMLSAGLLIEPVAGFASGIPSAQPNWITQFDPSIASVSTVHQGAPNAPVVYVIQDAHTNESAQLHIAGIISSILKRSKTEYVFMEAGSGDESIRFLRSNTNLNLLKSIGQQFLRKGKLQGAEYQNLIDESPFIIWGVEDQDLYNDALESYKAVAKNRDHSKDQLARMESALAALQNRLFSETVNEMAVAIESFQANEIEFHEYVGIQLKVMKRTGMNPSDYPYFKDLIDLKELEGDIDFVTANREFGLASKWVQSYAGEMFDGHSAQRLKSTEAERWKQILKEHEVTQRFPHLSQYLEYVEKVNQMQLGGVLDEIKTIGDQLILNLANQSESEILSAKQRVSGISDIIELRADAETYRLAEKFYDIHHPDFLIASINKLLIKHQLFPEKLMFESGEIGNIFAEAMNFYQLTLLRDEKILQNMTQKIEEKNLRESILIAGGFHTPNLTQKLKDAGYSFVLIEPVVSHETDMHRYEALLLNQANSIDRITPDRRKSEDQMFGLMRRRILNQSEDFLEFTSVVRPDLWEQLKSTALPEIAAAKLSAETGVEGPKEERFAQNQLFQQVLSDNSLVESEQLNTTGARLTADADEQRVSEINILLSDWDLDRVSEEERIETLLALLYGGSTIFPLVMMPAEHDEPAYSGRSSYKEGLVQILARVESGGNAEFQAETHQLISKIESMLEELGIPKTIPQKNGGEFNLHEALSVERYYFNPFLISFTGLPDHARGEDQGRFQKALGMLKISKAKKRKAKKLFLTYLDVHQPRVKVEDKDIYALRVKHSDLLGTPKGGVRYVTAASLLNDPAFRERFERLKKVGATKQALTYFTRRWVKQETLPLAVGMTTKTSAVNTGNKGNWWAEAVRSIFGVKKQTPMLGGAKGSILLADVQEQGGEYTLTDSFERSAEGLQNWYRVTRAYAAALYLAGKIGPDIDVPAPDVGVPLGAMDVATDEVLKIELESLRDSGVLDAWPASAHWIRDHLLSLLADYPTASPDNPLLLRDLSDVAVSLELGQSDLDAAAIAAIKPLLDLRSVFTAKSIDPEFLSGSAYRIEATGYGVVHVLDQVVRMALDELKIKFKKLHPDNTKLLSEAKQPLQHMTAKVMGFGNVGFEAIRELIERGVMVQMISEGPNGIIRKESGFTVQDLERLTELKKRHPHEAYFNLINNDEDDDIKIQNAFVLNGGDPEESFYNTHANIFVLAAKENSITTRNVAKMNADIYIEGANGAISYAAYDVLESRGAIVIPDSLANAGGVIVSYFEMLQNRMNQQWPTRKVISRLESYLNEAISEINVYRVDYKTDWRTAIDMRTIEMLLYADSGSRLTSDSHTAAIFNKKLSLLISEIRDFIEGATESESTLLKRALLYAGWSDLEEGELLIEVSESLENMHQTLRQARQEYSVYHSQTISEQIGNIADLSDDIWNFAHASAAVHALKRITTELRNNLQDIMDFRTDFEQLKDKVRQLDYASENFWRTLNEIAADSDGTLWSPGLQGVSFGYVLRLRRLAGELYQGIDDEGLLWQEEQLLLTQISEVLNRFQTSVDFTAIISEKMMSQLNRSLEADRIVNEYTDFDIERLLRFRFADAQDGYEELLSTGYILLDEPIVDVHVLISRDIPVSLGDFNRDITRFLLDQDASFGFEFEDESGVVGVELVNQWKLIAERWLIQTPLTGSRLADLEEAQIDDFSQTTIGQLAEFVRRLQSQAIDITNKVFLYLTDRNRIARLQIRYDQAASDTHNPSIWDLNQGQSDRMIVLVDPTESTDTLILREDYRDDLRQLQQQRAQVQSKFISSPDRQTKQIQKKVISVDLSVLEGGGLSDQAVYEAILPLLASEFQVRHARSFKQTVFYLTGPEKWITYLTDLAAASRGYIFHVNHDLPRAFVSDEVQRSNLIRPDAQTSRYKGVTIPVIAPTQADDQVALLPITAILDFAEAAAELIEADGQMDVDGFIALKNAYQVFIGQTLSDSMFRDIVTGKADSRTMQMYGIPALKQVPIGRLIKAFAIAIRMSAQSA